MTQHINRRDFLYRSLQSIAFIYGGNLINLMHDAQDVKSKATKELLWVETSGSAFDIGQQYGRKLADRLTSFVQNSLKKVRQRFDPEPMDKAYQVMLDVLEHDFPYIVQEIRGMAAGTKLDFKEVALSNLSAGFGAFVEEKEGCSNVIFTESDHGPILGKTLDGSSPESDTAVVRLIRQPAGHTVLCLTKIGGISTETGINERGLAVGESSLHFPTINPRGIIRNILPRLLLQECANVEEGIQFLSKFPVLRHGFHFALVDKAGNAVIVERSPAEMYVRRAEGKTIFCTNHAVTPCMRKLELSRGQVGDKNSDERFANLQRIISSPDFKLILDNMKNILQNHRLPGGICQHGELEMYTHRAYIAIPGEGKLLVAPGSPCKHEFKEFSLQGTK